MSDCLLEIRNLKKYFPIRGGILNKVVNHLKAVDDISFAVQRGETFGLVGESGCGKSTTGRSILKLQEPTDGQIVFDGRDITRLSGAQMRPLRQEMQMVFQDPYSSLSPRLRVFDILAEPLKAHSIGTRMERQSLIEQMMSKVGLNEEHLYRYPHEFSGGQRQRIGIARSLILNPKLVILDEPVSALDVSIQSQILNLLLTLQQDLDLTYLFISHDLSVVAHLCDRVAVMYLGRIVEIGDVESLFAKPLHPYTESLLEAIPEPNPATNKKRVVLAGDVPSAVDPPQGCAFHTRCLKCMDICKTHRPTLLPYSDGTQVACHLYAETRAQTGGLLNAKAT